MPDFLTEWSAQPHGEIERLDDGLLSVAGEIRMPLGNFPRRMTIIRLASGGTAIWSAIALREPEMQIIERLGRPEWLIVPGIAHRRDVPVWKGRYPDAKVLCAPGAAKSVAEAVPVDATADPFHDNEVLFGVVPGVGDLESAVMIERGGKLTLLVNDILANVRHPRGLGAKIMARLFGFGVRQPQMPWIGRRKFVTDKAALAAAFRHWAQQSALVRIVPSHGDIIDDDPRAVLTRIAARLET